MLPNQNRSEGRSENKVLVNHAIRSPRVLCITENGDNLGVISTSEALRRALDVGLDLVEVSPGGGKKPSTCKILDYGKFKYDESKKKKASEKKQRESLVETKEIKFRPTTDINDLKIKANKTNAFLSAGNQVKITVVFTGRELSHKEVAYDTLDTFMEFLPEAEILSQGAAENNNFSILLGKKKIK